MNGEIDHNILATIITSIGLITVALLPLIWRRLGRVETHVNGNLILAQEKIRLLEEEVFQLRGEVIILKKVIKEVNDGKIEV